MENYSLDSSKLNIQYTVRNSMSPIRKIQTLSYEITEKSNEKSNIYENDKIYDNLSGNCQIKRSHTMIDSLPVNKISNDIIENNRKNYEQLDNKNMTIKSIVENALIFKKEASNLAKEKKYDEAIILFLNVVCLVESVENNFQINISNLLANKNECWLNIAICLFHKKQYEDSIKYTNKILHSNKNNVRALYIKAKALKMMERYHEAYENIEHALTVKTNKNLLSEFNDLKEKLHIEQYKYNNPMQYNEPDLGEIKYNTTNNLLVKLIKIMIYKLVELIKNNKLLFAILCGLLIYSSKNRLYINWTKILNLISIQKTYKY